jgi:sulfur-oxidizing protein SoxZ
MASKMRVRAKLKGDETEVKALINHPMETGQRKDKKTGELIPAHFIEEVVCEHNGSMVMNALWSGGISKNPYLAFRFKGGAAGDKVKLSWRDNQGDSDELEVEIN